ncbi:MAG: Holliday junction branch migration protein RuvA [Limnochordia bacterium]|jgi:Holliday junction DNA helicase RuvA|nr:Holliday junction branch migration protein RuvA [Bacillota bacterium]HOB09635.1 Holliday junction branch migration protein RuvA [Limnochordia bacterium]NLH31790.1 Holliday junction branch migration protein RuvA [Bacillota bacterium]HPT93550.1 Holliday junction branch migration protein RuvA [Limnochordia bacterium]HPZ31551.1 Holliday junction branch migration protein RuvA [Limnochordia bacterium]
MIALLRGKIISQDQNMAILDVNGVGYQVYLSGAALERAKGSTEQITLHTHMHVKEDGIDLYGFATIDEKKLFQKIITVSGMGCKTAINILNAMSAEQFINAINLEDRAALTQISGIGKKTADRLILELRDEFTKAGFSLDSSISPPLTDAGMRNDALAALAALGFDYTEADLMLKAAVDKLGETSDLQLLLRTALASVDRRGK